MSANPIFGCDQPPRSRQNGLISRMEKMEIGQKSLRDDFLTELGETRADIMGRMDRLESGINDVRADVAVNMARADRAVLVNDNTCDEVRLLQAEITSMWLVIKRLEGRLP